ncbi:unnamed protein product [Closterium sp. NIES-54]
MAAAASRQGPWGGLLCGLALILICVMAFSIRLFSVIKYESVIHEFDPYFNYRVTQVIPVSQVPHLAWLSLARARPVSLWHP